MYMCVCVDMYAERQDPKEHAINFIFIYFFFSALPVERVCLPLVCSSQLGLSIFCSS